MTTEQMDDKDKQAGYVGITAQSLVDNTDARRKRDATSGPEILYGTPSHGELIEARKRAGRRGVLIVPESMRDALIASGGGWTRPLGLGDEFPDSVILNPDEPAPDLDPEQHFGHEDERVTDAEDHTHYSDRARVICAGGDHESAELWDRDLERIKVREAEAAEQDRIMREDGVVDITRHSEDTLFKVQAAITALGYSGSRVLDIIGSIQNAGILFREPAPDYDMQPARDDEPERTYNDVPIQAELPVEYRITDAFLDGYAQGFREGRHGRHR